MDVFVTHPPHINCFDLEWRGYFVLCQHLQFWFIVLGLLVYWLF